MSEFDFDESTFPAKRRRIDPPKRKRSIFLTGCLWLFLPVMIFTLAGIIGAALNPRKTMDAPKEVAKASPVAAKKAREEVIVYAANRTIAWHFSLLYNSRTAQYSYPNVKMGWK
jgi:hypothetical protein